TELRAAGALGYRTGRASICYNTLSTGRGGKAVAAEIPKVAGAHVWADSGDAEHEILAFADREEPAADDGADPRGDQLRRPRRDCAAVLPEVDHRGGVGLEAVRPARADRTRRLHARRLRELPLADDPSVQGRNRAIWPLLGRRRVRLRPPVHVGQQAHRAGPGARGRALQRRVAPRAPD